MSSNNENRQGLTIPEYLIWMIICSIFWIIAVIYNLITIPKHLIIVVVTTGAVAWILSAL